MWIPDIELLADFLLLMIPALILVAAVWIGVRQARSLRELTGDEGWLGRVLGLTNKKVHPAPPAPPELNPPIPMTRHDWRRR